MAAVTYGVLNRGRQHDGNTTASARAHAANTGKGLAHMLVVGIKPGHDGSMAAVRDGELVVSLEAEKDSFKRYSSVGPSTVLEFAEHVGGLPDVIALGGWSSRSVVPHRGIGAGYLGIADGVRRS